MMPTNAINDSARKKSSELANTRRNRIEQRKQYINRLIRTFHFQFAFWLWNGMKRRKLDTRNWLHPAGALVYHMTSFKLTISYRFMVNLHNGEATAIYIGLCMVGIRAVFLATHTCIEHTHIWFCIQLKTRFWKCMLEETWKSFRNSCPTVTDEFQMLSFYFQLRTQFKYIYSSYKACALPQSQLTITHVCAQIQFAIGYTIPKWMYSFFAFSHAMLLTISWFFYG